MLLSKGCAYSSIDFGCGTGITDVSVCLFLWENISVGWGILRSMCEVFSLVFGFRVRFSVD